MAFDAPVTTFWTVHGNVRLNVGSAVFETERRQSVKVSVTVFVTCWFWRYAKSCLPPPSDCTIVEIVMLADTVIVPGLLTLLCRIAVPVPSGPSVTVVVVVPVPANVPTPLVMVSVAVVNGVPVTTIVRVVPAHEVASAPPWTSSAAAFVASAA